MGDKMSLSAAFNRQRHRFEVTIAKPDVEEDGDSSHSSLTRRLTPLCIQKPELVKLDLFRERRERGEKGKRGEEEEGEDE